ADAAIVDDKPESEAELGILFTGQAALDKDTEVIVQKDKGVASARLVDLIDRAKAAGLSKFTIR
ncbi:MAG TPA: hypothetical protein VGC41_02275, partial [Kofleriaceae bacterium]